MPSDAASLVTTLRTDSGVETIRPLLPLQTKNLTLVLGGKCLLDAVNLTLATDKVTAILGPTGAGKSLLLRLLHGLLPPTGGEILWGGKAIDDSVRQRQAMVFQKPVLLRRSVAANLDFVLRPKGAAAKARRDALLAEVDLLGRAKQPARLLSGGEQQRLALARALAVAPDILFLDEPTASLDPASVLMIEEIVGKVRRQGTKIILITHDQAQARRMAEEVVFLHQGRLLEYAVADRFFSSPQSDAAQAYLDGRIVL